MTTLDPRSAFARSIEAPNPPARDLGSGTPSRARIVVIEPARRDPSVGHMPLQMPAGEYEAADDISFAGAEGRPADAKAGPGLLAIEIAFVALGLGLVALGVSIWIDWQIALVILALGLVALAWNPVIAAMLFRIRDRQKAAEVERENVNREN